MKKGDRKFYNIFFRYLILVLIALPGMDLFYYIFSPLTKYPVFWALSLSYNSVLLNNSIFIGAKTIEIIGACIAGSAYYMLLILNLSTPEIKWLKRIKIMLFTFITFLIINALRIYLLSLMYLKGSQFFDIAHKMFWYLGSTILLVAIWFLTVKIFKIKKTPFYDDVKTIYKESAFKKAKTKRKKAIKKIKKNSKN